MGCKECKVCDKNLPSDQKLIQQLKEAIDSTSNTKIRNCIALIKNTFKGKSSIFDSPFITFQHLKNLNALCYCLLKGKHEIFSTLLNEGASLNEMNRLFEKNNLRALDIVCAKGHVEILKILLPKYLESKNPVDNIESTIYFPDFKQEESTPVRLATKSGIIPIIFFIRNFFSNYAIVPAEFDVNAINLRTGENCGLYACKCGNLPLLKFLYENCNTDLKILDNNNENAVIICLKGFKKKKIYNYFHCIKYLVDFVHIDITHKYHYMINLAECPDTKEFLKSRLVDLGIQVEQTEVNNSPFQDIYQNSVLNFELGVLLNHDVHSTFGSTKEYSI